MNTGDIEERMRPQDIDSPIPTDTQNPRMYLHGIYIMGAAGLASIIAIGVLAGMGVTVPTELGVIAGLALGGVANIFGRKQA